MAIFAPLDQLISQVKKLRNTNVVGIFLSDKLIMNFVEYEYSHTTIDLMCSSEWCLQKKKKKLVDNLIQAASFVHAR